MLSQQRTFLQSGPTPEMPSLEEIVFVDTEELTIELVHSCFKNGTYTCQELVQAYIARIEALDQTGPKLNAITAISPTCLEEAKALDQHLKIHGSFVGPLHGVPVVVKDQADTKDIPTAYGAL